MPTIFTRLAYALQVDAADLAAAIEIDAQLRPAINTLQLCNRLGGTAPITTIPTELVDQIEEYLTTDRLEAMAQRRSRVQIFGKCLTGDCTQTYSIHMTEDDQLVHVNEGLVLAGEPVITSLAGMTRKEVEDWILSDPDFGFSNEDCRLAHSDHIREWYELMGQPGDTYGGMFKRNRGFVREYYGLEVFVAHLPYSFEANARSLTYLALPDDINLGETHAKEVFARRCGRGSEDCDIQRTAESFTREVAMPAALSASESARFLKMVTKLGLPGWELGKGDAEDEVVRERATPKLTLLAQIMDHRRE
ncbi:hypothetical protein LTR17_021927 [Elasticomyces elasticus]|nr:hypothetical protein LTR17_021927 [Elasticomyces elasticus]